MGFDPNAGATGAQGAADNPAGADQFANLFAAMGMGNNPAQNNGNNNTQASPAAKDEKNDNVDDLD
jgi:hypothetical protein